jgi:hypothetical protein
MDDYPVKIGQMLFTMVDPHRGREVVYNRWYERDHFYAGCMIGPHLFAGKRWVATRELKDLRFPEESPFAEPVGAGSYLSIYWVEAGHEDEHWAWARKQVFWLYSHGRGFAERSHAHTKLYEFEDVHYADPDGVPVELALDHPWRGLVVLSIEPPEGASHDELRATVAAGHVPGLLATPGVESVADWRLHLEEGEVTAPMDLGATGGSDERLVQLCFLSGDPANVWDGIRAYAAGIAGAGAGAVSFAAPFLPTLVGTDRYTDELW